MKILAVILSLLSITNFSNAQPKLLIQVYGGYLIPVAELRGSLPTTINTNDMRYRVNLPINDSNTYFMKSGFQIGTAVKLSVSSKGYLRLVLNGIYKHFSSSQQSSLSYNNSTYANLIFEPSMNIFTLGLGVEYGFMPANKVNPYVSSDLKVNFVSGMTHVNTHYISSNTTYDSTYSMNSTVRFGMGVTGGVEIKFLKNIGVVAGIRYGIENLLRTNTDTTKILGTTPNQSYDLNDKEYVYRNQTWPVKLIADLQFLAGFSYYFGSYGTKKK